MGFAITMRMDGLSKALARLRGAKKKIPARSMKKALRVAATPVIDGARRWAPRQTGKLKQSMSVRMKSYRRGQIILSVIGPKHFKYANGKNPGNYGHLVELGHNIVRGGRLSRGTTIGTGRIVGQVQPRRFMKRSSRASLPVAAKRFEMSLRLNVLKDFSDV